MIELFGQRIYVVRDIQGRAKVWNIFFYSKTTKNNVFEGRPVGEVVRTFIEAYVE